MVLQPGSKTLSVLIIDPSAEDRRQATELVKWVDRRHRVEEVELGAEGWQRALRCRPKLILCAPALPDISGIELCAGLRARLRRTQSVAVSWQIRYSAPCTLASSASSGPCTASR